MAQRTRYLCATSDFASKRGEPNTKSGGGSSRPHLLSLSTVKGRSEAPSRQARPVTKAPTPVDQVGLRFSLLPLTLRQQIGAVGFRLPKRGASEALPRKAGAMTPLDDYALRQKERTERVERLSELLKSAAAVATDLDMNVLSSCLWDSADDLGDWI